MTKQKAPILTDEEIWKVQQGNCYWEDEQKGRAVAQAQLDKCHEYYTKSDVPDDEDLREKIAKDICLICAIECDAKMRSSCSDLDGDVSHILALVKPYYEQKIEQVVEDAVDNTECRLNLTVYPKLIEQAKRETAEAIFKEIESRGIPRWSGMVGCDWYQALKSKYPIKEVGEDNGS
jgi:hypothetical protein